MTYSGAQPYFPEQDRQGLLVEIDAILSSGRLTQGSYLQAFEAACAEMAGTQYAIAVNSGGMALELALSALNTEPGDFIVPTETFVASPNSVLRAGYNPVFADINSDTLSLSVETIKAAMTPRTRGIMLVHMFGIMSAEIPEIQAFCKLNNLVLVEDAAHAHGGRIGEQRAGNLGQAACFSFYGTKILTTGEGGVVTTNDSALTAALRSLRDHGRSTDGVRFDRVSNNFRMAEIPALLGVYQQRRLREIVEHRRMIATVYRNVLSGCDKLRIIDPEPREGHTYWRYAIVLAAGIDRNKIQRIMEEKHKTRVTWMYEPLCHAQPFYANRIRSGRFPNAEVLVGRLVNLPTHMGIDSAAAAKIADNLLQTIEEVAV